MENTPIYRRFIPIGTKEEMDKFHTLIKETNLSRDDLITILRAIKLNPNIYSVPEKVKLSSEQKTLYSLVRLAQEAEDLGLEDDIIDAILAIYAKYKERNQDLSNFSAEEKAFIEASERTKARQNI